MKNETKNKSDKHRALELKKDKKRKCSRHYISYLYCPYEHTSCKQCDNFK
jgi:hypothetical protein